jgi:hypothetical protein
MGHTLDGVMVLIQTIDLEIQIYQAAEMMLVRQVKD